MARYASCGAWSVMARRPLRGEAPSSDGDELYLGLWRCRAPLPALDTAPARKMATQKICLVMVIFVLLFGLAGPIDTSSRETPNDQFDTDPCGKKSDEWIPWFSCAISIFLMFVPMQRGFMTLGQLTERNAMYWWFLCVNTMNHFSWIGYSRNCTVDQSGYPIFVMSLTGVALHILFLAASTLAVQHDKIKNYKMGIAILLNVTMLMSAICAPSTVNGCLGLIFGVLAQLCRMKATEYENFNWLLFLGSALGIHGLIWPPKFMLYKITSDIISAIRIIEAFWWCSPWIMEAAWRIEKEGAEEHDQ